eukprot:490632-Pleurochrysis_carterae.AAC.1
MGSLQRLQMPNELLLTLSRVCLLEICLARLYAPCRTCCTATNTGCATLDRRARSRRGPDFGAREEHTV